MEQSQVKWFKRAFIVYIYVLMYYLFVYQRSMDFSWMVFGGFPTLFERMQERINLIPFTTIYRYLLTMNYATGMRTIVVNIGGHMLFFSPLGYFLPRLRARFQNWTIFLGTIVLMMVLIELIQLLSMSGSFDVDDIILNTIGAMLGFIFLRDPEQLEENE
jgi:glycopeptide antibiotics resistance protein